MYKKSSELSVLTQICEKSWALTALALIDDGVTPRVAPLAAAAGTSRSAMTPSLAHLVQLGLLARNSGHGHPLRPELILTTSGRQWAARARRLIQSLHEPAEQRLCRMAWTLPVLACANHPIRFTQFKGGLLTISDRSLALTLGRLQDQGWMDRDVSTQSRPPVSIYEAIGKGARLADLINA